MGADKARAAADEMLQQLRTDYVVSGREGARLGVQAAAVSAAACVFCLQLWPDAPKAKNNSSRGVQTRNLITQDLLLIHWPGASGVAADSPRNAELRLETWRVCGCGCDAACVCLCCATLCAKASLACNAELQLETWRVRGCFTCAVPLCKGGICVQVWCHLCANASVVCKG